MAARWTTERKIVLGFSSALVALCVVAGMSVWLTLALLADLDAVSKQSSVVADQNAVLSRISELNGMLAQLATYARLFGANHDEKTFLEWQAEEQEFEKKLDELDATTNDSPTQVQRMATIKRMLREKVSATTRTASREELDRAWGIVNGSSQVRPLSDTLIDMSVEERAVLGEKNDEARQKNEDATREAHAALWAIGVSFALAMLLIAGAVWAILRDLRLRRRAAEELERARQAAEAASIAKSIFLANMSHELRTPLTSIMGYLDLMLTPEAGASTRPEHLQTMRRSGEHLLTLINDILDVSKIEAGRMETELIECRLTDIMADVDSLMRPRALGKGIAFSIQYATAIPERVRTDPTRFRQILMNLVSNAIKFTDEGSARVIISCKDSGMHAQAHRIVVEVIDTGVGISAEQQRHLFQPFSQADISTTRRFGGTGLGLSISRRLAQMLGGDLSIRSELGAGSTFRLSLPMEAVPGAAMIPAHQAGHLVQGAARMPDGPSRSLGLRVLLAEDGPDNRDVILLHLRHAGCVATAVEDGQRAFEVALQAARIGTPFDVVLMDMQMPVMDGYTATAKLRAESYTGIIIALTANAMKEDRERCLRVGCDEYVTKPVEIPALLQIMARLSGRRGDALSVFDKLLENPALRQLIRKFCDGLPGTLEGFHQLVDRAQWDELTGAAHRMAGAGGAYGFDAITRDAKALERAARTANPVQIAAALEALAQTCAAAQQQIAATAAPSTPKEPLLAPAPAPQPVNH